VIVIYQGQVVEDGSLAAVRKRHRDKTLEDIFVGLTGQEGI
jgi:ABC-2 type transport system ATP-binding protein